METLRIQKTKYTQEEFAKRCGIPRRTYLRWISGETQAKLTPAQVKAICKELDISVFDIPDDFSEKYSKK